MTPFTWYTERVIERFVRSVYPSLVKTRVQDARRVSCAGSIFVNVVLVQGYRLPQVANPGLIYLR
jgi:hypothetical protein